MLTALRLGNFKAFADTQTIPLKPLTLIFGPNSSGKSSIIHGLLWAHEALRTGDENVRRTQLGGDAVDLGGFWQFHHGGRGGGEFDHTELPFVEWGAEFSPEDPAAVFDVKNAAFTGVYHPYLASFQLISDGAPLVDDIGINYRNPLLRRELLLRMTKGAPGGSRSLAKRSSVDRILEAASAELSTAVSMPGGFLPEGLPSAEMRSTNFTDWVDRCEAGKNAKRSRRRASPLEKTIRGAWRTIIHETIYGIGQSLRSEVNKLRLRRRSGIKRRREVPVMNPLLERVSINPNVWFGKPCIKGTRIWVSLILDYLANGEP